MNDVPQLNITCGTADCDNGHHAYNARTFVRRGRDRQFCEAGVCKACGDASVDWGRVHLRNVGDVAYTFAALQHETIRWDFWERPFNDKAISDSVARGRQGIEDAIVPTLQRIVGPVPHGYWQRLAVPTDQHKLTNVIQYAQHAVAACCRDCIEKWHGISQDHDLSQSELEYLKQLTVHYLEKRLWSS